MFNVQTFQNESDNLKNEREHYENIFLERINNICKRIKNPWKFANHTYIESIFCWSYYLLIPMFLITYLFVFKNGLKMKVFKKKKKRGMGMIIKMRG